MSVISNSEPFSDDFLEAIRGHAVVGQALGLLMERFDLSEESAFDYLRRLSNDGNIKVLAIAEGLLVEHAQLVRQRRT